MRLFRSAPALVLALVVAGCSLEGDSNRASTSTSVAQTTGSLSTTSQPTTTTTIIPSELAAGLEELSRLWTPDCEAMVVRRAHQVVDLVRDWEPTLGQALGDFGGDPEALGDDSALDPSCPEAG